MSILLHGDCLELMKDIENESVDFIFCDLPYGVLSCKWDCPIDLELFWKEIMRIKKLNTPIFMTTTTKFGVSLIQSAPKKCPFRWDLVWVKSAPSGFLSARKMPMRKHEMVYAFYEKLPFYDLSSHKHKFVKDNRKKIDTDNIYGTPIHPDGKSGSYDPPLPVSVVKEERTPSYYMKDGKTIYNGGKAMPIFNKGGTAYDPPLPTSMLEIKSTRGKHSTEKPVALMEYLLKYFSKEGDVVLDPTMGSGSTGVACKNMNRNFIGMEMDPEIYEVAVNRIDF
tara:strand:+ start:377 stop:1216 length:840 start_codon:yes stop_codon:yes gene_type:complete